MATPGHDGPRLDGVAKVTGAAQYAGDLRVPGLVHAKILRATLPHALIRRIDASRALAMPGVIAVVTGRDVNDINAHFGTYLRDRPLIALDRVRYVGEPVAAAVAVDELTATEALEAIDVDYDELPFVVATEDALKPDAPLLHEAPESQTDYYFKGRANRVPGTNVVHQTEFVQGDPERALAEAAHVFDDVFTFPAVYHYAMEPHTAIASWDGDGLTVWSSAQAPFAVQKSLADVFRLPAARVRVVVPFLGGGFGSKSSIKIEPLVAGIARTVRRPVRLAQSVHESMVTCRRLGATIRLRTGVDRDGRLVAKIAEIVMDNGAYSDSGPAVSAKAGNRVVGPYRIPNLRIEVRSVYTNTVPGASFRSIGGPQATWATESQMDVIAAALGLDPVELRRRNLAAKGDTIRAGLTPLDVDLAPALELAAEAATPPRREGDEVVAGGVAMGASDPAAVALATAIVRLKRDGSVLVFSSAVEMGQGVRTVFAGIVARELGVRPDAVSFAAPDTSVTPHDWATGASRSTTVTGSALQDAAAEARRKVIDMAAAVLGVAGDRARLEDGAVTDGERRATFAELFHAYFGIHDGEVIGVGQVTPRSHGGRLAKTPPFWETAVAGCTVGVDPETGVIRVRRYVSVADVGHVMHRQLAEGQDEGAAVQGLGHALFEELRWEDGQPVNATLLDYHVPTIDDAPADFHTVLVESGDGPGPYGARGMGEGGILPAAPAVANALARALGVRVRELPLTPERVWRALRAAGLDGPPERAR